MEITKDILNNVMPAKLQHRVDADVINTIKEISNDDGLGDSIRENILSYTSVLRDGRFKITDYLNAVKYSTFKLLGDTNTTAFARTFPEKYSDWKAEPKPQKEIARYTTAYNQSKLVTLIMAQARLPTHILNADIFQKAINTQVEIMTDEEVSPKVRSDAANSLLTHIKAPEVQKIELDIGIKEESRLNQLREVTRELASKQVNKVIEGVITNKEIAHQNIIVDTVGEED